MSKPANPQSETELLNRAWQLAGMRFSELAHTLNIPLPVSNQAGKGWFGQCAERYLGATAGSLPQPDFITLGIELKTLPLTQDYRPKESTYVCTVSAQLTGETWEKSWIRQKLAKVLWLPYEADSAIPWGQRQIATALLWSPNPAQNQALAADWEELMTTISLGQENQLTSHQGRFLQVRPKAANARSLTNMVDTNGENQPTLPRGFYLRPEFTQQILEQHYFAR